MEQTIKDWRAFDATEGPEKNMPVRPRPPIFTQDRRSCKDTARAVGHLVAHYQLQADQALKKVKHVM